MDKLKDWLSLRNEDKDETKTLKLITDINYVIKTIFAIIVEFNK